MATWFYGKEMGLASSVDVIANLGGGMSIFLERKLYDYYDSIMPPLYISLIPISISVIACIIVLTLDKCA